MWKGICFSLSTVFQPEGRCGKEYGSPCPLYYKQREDVERCLVLLVHSTTNRDDVERFLVVLVHSTTNRVRMWKAVWFSLSTVLQTEGGCGKASGSPFPQYYNQREDVDRRLVLLVHSTTKREDVERHLVLLVHSATNSGRMWKGVWFSLSTVLQPEGGCGQASGSPCPQYYNQRDDVDRRLVLLVHSTSNRGRMWKGISFSLSTVLQTEGGCGKASRSPCPQYYNQREDVERCLVLLVHSTTSMGRMWKGVWFSLSTVLRREGGCGKVSGSPCPQYYKPRKDVERCLVLLVHSTTMQTGRMWKGVWFSLSTVLQTEGGCGKASGSPCPQYY
jgi:hypothetical protein